MSILATLSFAGGMSKCRRLNFDGLVGDLVRAHEVWGDEAVIIKACVVKCLCRFAVDSGNVDVGRGW